MDGADGIHIKMDYYSAAQKHDTMIFSGKWMDLRNITDSEKTLMFAFICGPSLQCIHAYM